jgi:hypothetical protein
VICTAAVGALNASFQVAPGGQAYSAAVEVVDATTYGFWDVGPLGERIPRTVANVSLRGACGNCSFNWVDPYTMNFTKGNYTILYSGGILENHLQGSFEKPYRVSITLPPGLDVRNPALGMRSPGSALRENGSSLDIGWNATRSFELRYYTPDREELLYIFGALWLVGLVLVLVPYLLERRARERGKGP